MNNKQRLNYFIYIILALHNILLDDQHQHNIVNISDDENMDETNEDQLDETEEADPGKTSTTLNFFLFITKVFL